ncbi:MAG TPA: TraM recognition domain-containing protein [Candidatus Saccharimonadales bacterium]
MTSNITDWLQTLEGLFPWIVGALILVAVVTLVLFVTLDLLDVRRLLQQKAVFLELTPPANANKTPEATKHLFAVLHGLETSRTLLEKLLRRKVVFSLELVSTKQQGIRYVLRVPESDAATFEQTILSYLPDAKLRRIDDYMPDGKGARVLDLKQTGHFAYPLHTQLTLDEHDPMAYLTGIMTKLSPDELMSFQIVVSPTKVREAGVITSRLIHNDELVYRLGKPKMPASKIFDGINTFLFGVLDSVGDTLSGPSKNKTYQAQASHKQQVAMKIKPARVLSPFEQRLAESVHDKLSQPLFRVNIRAFIVMEDKEREKQRAKGVREWLASLAVPKYQALRVRRTYADIQTRYWQFVFSHRLPAFFSRNACLLSAAELADLYHFPHTETAKTENVVKSLSKTLPAPLSLKNGAQFDVILGRNHHHGTYTDIGLTTAERERHVYVIGGTGNGKTTMMLYGMEQDLRHGKGFAFVDPHGDAAETVLRYVPKERVDDVIYFNPDDLAHPIGLNLLELTPGLTGDELIREKDLVTESTVSVFRKIFSEDDSGGHRIEYVLRNTVQTALTVEGATLFTVFDLLNDPKYRKSVISKLEDKELKNFWKNELGKAGEMQRVKMAAGITAKVGRFLFSASAKRILEQPKSTIDFDDIINSGKILICNFSKGLLGEDTSELFGITVLAKLQMAALRRARVNQTERRPFYLYVDEFQNFATASFVQLLSEARKYKLFLMMAEQSTSQQAELRTVQTILANVGTVICFRTGNPADEQFLLPLFEPYVQRGELANLPAFNFYIRLAAVRSQEPFSGETVVLEDEGSETTAAKAVAASRKNYTIKPQPKVEEPRKKRQPQKRTAILPDAR